jgi:exodeoxyribonuclease V alpha subunit
MPSFDADKPLEAVAPGAHLLLVGDVDQLPSAGAGEVLRDLLAAGSLPVVRLTKIFRQAQQSGIVVGAHPLES